MHHIHKLKFSNYSKNDNVGSSLLSVQVVNLIPKCKMSMRETCEKSPSFMILFPDEHSSANFIQVCINFRHG